MRKTITFSVLILLVLVGVYMYWFYYRTYSQGSRPGMLQKFSRKGDVFKTYEGELLQGGFGQSRMGGPVSAQYFYFSVTDEKVAAQLEASQGQNITVHYTQYKRSLPWRGENYDTRNAESGQYIVDRVEVQAAGALPGGGAPAQAYPPSQAYPPAQTPQPAPAR